MSRRNAGVAAIVVAGLVATGAIPLFGTATAADCPSWTDNPNDATFFQLPAPATAEPALDILETTVKTVGTDIAVTIRAASMSATATKYGDHYSVQMSVAGKSLLFYADRPAVGTVTAEVLNLATSTAGAATATYDTTNKAMTITASQAEVDKAAGTATKGLTATAMATTTALQADSRPIPSYDNSSAPAAVTYAVGMQCGPVGPEPTGSSSPSPTSSPGTLPVGYPKVGCTTFEDGSGDGSAVVASPATFPNEAGLDIRAVSINTTSDRLLAYVKIATLGDKPANFQGDRFELAFKVGTKEYRFAVGRGGTGTSSATHGKVDGTTNAGLGVTGTFDKTNGYVILAIDRAKLDTVNGSAVGAGTTLTNVRAETVGMQPQRDFYADYAEHSDATKRTYTVGESPCFEPPASKLVHTGAVKVQYTDAATIAAKLTAEVSGEALAGKPVTFTIGSRTLTATTGTDGVASTTLTPGLVGGAYSLVASFAGDPTAKAVSITTPFSVTPEKTRLTLSVKKSGTKRTVIARLTDDDGKVVASQLLAWYINGKKVSSVRMGSTGTATLTSAKPTQTVKAVFTAVTGKYLGISAQVKV